MDLFKFVKAAVFFLGEDLDQIIFQDKANCYLHIAKDGPTTF